MSATASWKLPREHVAHVHEHAAQLSHSAESAAQPSADDREWDEFVANNVHGYHEQTSFYGRIRVNYGFACHRAVVRDGAQIVGGAQVIAQPTHVGTFARVLRGPIVLHDDPTIYERVVEELDRLAVKKRFAAVRIETLSPQANARDALSSAGYIPSDAWFGGRRSLVARIERSDQEQLHALKRKTRYAVRSAQRSGVVIHIGADASIDDFYELYRRSANHHRYVPFPADFFAYLWRTLGSTGQLQLFVAQHERQPVAAMINAVMGNTMYYGWCGSHRDSEGYKLMAHDLLHYTAMCWARDRGCTHYDFGGTQMNKRKFADEQIDWPLPQRKFYGPLRGLRATLLERTWSQPLLRRGIKRAASHLQLNPRMPW